jgi:CRP/FNR family transcriptional regulator, cyclic AMP receptor protein
MKGELMETKTLAEVVREHAFMEGMKQSHILKIADMALEIQFARDQMIFKEGDESALFYLIVAGKVALEVSAPGRILRVQTLGPGDELGWSSLLGTGGKQFNARSLEPVHALAFDGARLRQACEQDPAFGYQFMLKLVNVVARRLQATRLQLLDVYAPRGVKLV